MARLESTWKQSTYVINNSTSSNRTPVRILHTNLRIVSHKQYLNAKTIKKLKDKIFSLNKSICPKKRLIFIVVYCAWRLRREYITVFVMITKIITICNKYK